MHAKVLRGEALNQSSLFWEHQLSVIHFPEGAKQNEEEFFAFGNSRVDECEVSWLLWPLWQNAEGRFYCWEGNEKWNNNGAAQQSPGPPDRPCLATGLHTYFGDNYLHCYTACNTPATLLPSRTHNGTKHSRFKQERFVLLSGEQIKKNQLRYQDINMMSCIMTHFVARLSWWCLFVVRGFHY